MLKPIVQATALVVGLAMPAIAHADSITILPFCNPTAWHAGNAAYHVYCGNTGWVGVFNIVNGTANAAQVVELSRHQPFNYRLTGGMVDSNAAVTGSATVPEITGIMSPGVQQ